MKKNILLLMFVLYLTSLAVAGEADSLLSLYSTNLSIHKSFKADFKQYRYLAIFPKPLISTGTIFFKYPDKIAFKYKTPFESVILMSKSNMERYRIEEGKAIKQESMEVVAKAITNEVMRYLKGNFTDNFPYTVEFNPKEKNSFILTPKSALARTVFANITLTFSETKDYIKSIRLNEVESGNYILIEHQKPEFGELTDSVFSADMTE